MKERRGGTGSSRSHAPRGNEGERQTRGVRGRIPSLTRLVLLSAFPLCLCGEPSSGAEPRPLPAFERIVIDPDFPGGYQVEVADVNGDGKPDVVALGGGSCAW